MITAYRVWDGENMHHWDDEGISLGIIGTQWVLWRNDRYGFQNCITGSHEEGSALMWGTGLKDKNGRVIYEGDIRKDALGRIFKVVYENDLAAFYGEYTNGHYESLGDCGPDSEFLGTVYQNPELLEGAE
ncbi:YopX family protein [Bacillus vallismortis]|uniref:YopX family protein n=1 Tax=Bacillus vallismortis TaxID=72361 RepID=UPI0025ADAB2A|nr:YopX family protein [Bacillus vallismortis]MCO4849947.1 hypothetical protein [Bacillus vallismortis]